MMGMDVRWAKDEVRTAVLALKEIATQLKRQNDILEEMKLGSAIKIDEGEINDGK